MIVTRTDIIQGAEIQSYLGIVTAEVVYGTNALRDFFAGIRDIIGGRTGSYEEVFLKGQRDALAELEKRAQRLGANAVIGVEVDTSTINVDTSGALLLITAVGTAVGCISMSANIFVEAKHSSSKSLILTNKLSTGMLRPYKIEMHPGSKIALSSLSSIHPRTFVTG